MVKSQSAMEYLMTYGWAILIIAVVLAVLFQLGVFSSASFTSTSCTAQAGFLCAHPIMNTTGNVLITLGQAGSQTITVTALGCSNSTAEPSFVSLPKDIVLTPDQSNATSAVFQCPIVSQVLGTPFAGYLWVEYTTPDQSTPSYETVATLTAVASTTGIVGAPKPSMSFVSAGVNAYQPLNNALTATVPSGASLYLCGVGSTYGSSQPANFVIDAGNSNAESGHLTSGNECTYTQTYSAGYASLVGIGLKPSNGYTTSYTVSSSLVVSQYVDSSSVAYTVSEPDSFVVLIAACGYTCATSSITLPAGAGCQQQQYQVASSGIASYIATCSAQAAGSYTFRIDTTDGGNPYNAVMLTSAYVFAPT